MSNVPPKQQKFPLCSNSGGNSKTLFLKLKTQQNNIVPLCSPLFLPKSSREKEGVKIGKMEKKDIYRGNIGTKGGTRGNNTDPRFRSESFRKTVRFVLESLGFKSNMKNFKEWDNFFDWQTLSGNLRNPKKIQTRCSVCGKKANVLVVIEATNKCCCSSCWQKVLSTPNSNEDRARFNDSSN